MFIAKVIGNVWATRKHKTLQNVKLLLVKPLNPTQDNKPAGDVTLALDSYQDAGVGDTVLVIDEGGSARKVLKNDKAPVRTVVAGIVDAVYQKEGL